MKFVKIRTRLAKLFWRLSLALVPPPEATEIYKSLPDELKQSTDASVEVEDGYEQWAPEQQGNVVIVEPEIMHQYRRTNDV